MPSFTRQAIMKTFVVLLNERPLSQITVKDIVEECGVNRNSFYYYFQDLPSLIEAIFKDEYDRMFAEHARIDTLEECLNIIIDYALKNKKAVLHLYRSQNRELYEQHLNSMAEYAVSEYIRILSEENSINPRKDDVESIIYFYRCELVGFVLAWMDSGMQYDICEKVNRICELFSGSMLTALKRSAGIEKM